MSDVSFVPIPAELDGWQLAFEQNKIDYVPDPMVLRVGDLFIGGKSGAKAFGLDPALTWHVIEKNVDALGAFFHILMTRERIPLIDYEQTFPAANLYALAGMHQDIHPNHSIYQSIKRAAQEKIRKVDIMRLPADRAHTLAEELRAVGYEWYPNPADPRLDSDPDRRTVATFLVGGLIFNEYAKASGTDHLLQKTRAQLFVDLALEPDRATTRVAKAEDELFARLDAVVNVDPNLRKLDVNLPPSVLPYLLDRQPASPQDLLNEARKLRDEPEWKKYREWYHKMRSAWVRGEYDEKGEHDLVDVAKEIGRRYESSKYRADAQAVWSKEIGVKVSSSVTVGVAKAAVEVDAGKYRISLPNSLRDWVTETLLFRNHRKVLLQIGLAQHQYDDFVLGLKNLWEKQATC
jgi:hypothetical protein